MLHIPVHILISDLPSPHLLILFLTSIMQGVKSALVRLNKATEYSSSSDEVGSSDDEERNRWGSSSSVYSLHWPFKSKKQGLSNNKVVLHTKIWAILSVEQEDACFKQKKRQCETNFQNQWRISMKSLYSNSDSDFCWQILYMWRPFCWPLNLSWTHKTDKFEL